MPAAPHPAVKSPLRFCLSCALTLVCWALWLVLAAGIGIQAYVAATREVPVPDFILRRIEGELAAARLEVKFGSARGEPNGRLLLENVSLRSKLFEEPLFTSRMVYLRKSLWSVLAGHPLPDEIRVEGATLQLPAILSPSGAAEPLLRDFAGTVHYEHGDWIITQLAGQVGTVRVTVHGEFSAERRAGTTTVTLDELTNQFLKVGRRVAAELPRLSVLDQPALDVEFRTTATHHTEVRLRLVAAAAHLPGEPGPDLGPLTVTGDWEWTGGAPHPLRLRGRIERLVLGDRAEADRIRFRAELLPAADLTGLRDARLRVSALAVRGLGEQLDQPVVDATLNWPARTLQVETAFRAHGEALAASARADLAGRSATVSFRGRLQPALVTGALTRYGPKLEPYFRFGDPVAFEGRAVFAPGWHFDRLETWVRCDRLDSHGVPVTLATGRITADAAGNFLADDALAALGVNFARGSYWMNFRTHAYRMLLVGQLRPPEISGWFHGDWWPEFWKSFSFPVSPPRADVDVQGNWADPTQTSYFGGSQADGASVIGADFEKIDTRIFVRPTFDHVIDVTATRAGGSQQVTGWFKRFASPATHRTLSWEYAGSGNVDPAVLARIGPASAATPLAPWSFDKPPAVKVSGRTVFPAEGPPVNQVQFSVQTDSVKYHDFPIEQLSLLGKLEGDDLRLEPIEFGAAGGKATAQIRVTGDAAARRVAFSGGLKEADLARAIRALEAITAGGTKAGASAITDSKFIKRARGGKLDLTLSAQADPADTTSLRGNGTVQISGTELGEIHLFGLLSQLLSAMWLNFSSLKLDSAKSSFVINQGSVHFPDVRISGPSAVIDAKGDYLIASHGLDFTARLKPYEETRNPLTMVVGIVVNPLTSIFELKLSGPLAKPSWSLALGSSGGGKSAVAKPAAEASPVKPAETTPKP